jgi:hypothetical protein
MAITSPVEGSTVRRSTISSPIYSYDGLHAMPSIGLILLIVLILLLLGAVPAWPHARGWGYGPSGVLGLLLVVVIVLLLLGRL